MILAEAVPLLNVTWYVLIIILLAGYVVLDGFDLGVGSLHLFARGDRDRRIMLNAIGPVWDGNEVWLVTGGGALFAAFPPVYATVLLLMALFGLGMFPNMVYSAPDPSHSLTAYNAASTEKTLKIMTLIAAIGVPIVLTYTVTVYYIFRGKVKVGKDSY
jgi:cytochrome bd-type quinol oxidase subunit 2